MSIEIPVTQARDELADLINRVAYGHERIVLTRHAKPVACLVPPEDLAWLEQAGQSRIDLRSAGPALQPPLAPVPLPIAARHTGGQQAGGQQAAAQHRPEERPRG